MIMKVLFAASMLIPVTMLSGAAQAGNEARIPTAGNRAIEVASPHAAAKHPGGFECRYQGGPKAPMLHVRT